MPSTRRLVLVAVSLLCLERYRDVVSDRLDREGVRLPWAHNETLRRSPGRTAWVLAALALGVAAPWIGLPRPWLGLLAVVAVTVGSVWEVIANRRGSSFELALGSAVFRWGVPATLALLAMGVAPGGAGPDPVWLAPVVVLWLMLAAVRSILSRPLVDAWLHDWLPGDVTPIEGVLRARYIVTLLLLPSELLVGVVSVAGMARKAPVVVALLAAYIAGRWAQGRWLRPGRSPRPTTRDRRRPTGSWCSSSTSSWSTGLLCWRWASWCR